MSIGKYLRGRLKPNNIAIITLNWENKNQTNKLQVFKTPKENKSGPELAGSVVWGAGRVFNWSLQASLTRTRGGELARRQDKFGKIEKSFAYADGGLSLVVRWRTGWEDKQIARTGRAD